MQDGNSGATVAAEGGLIRPDQYGFSGFGKAFREFVEKNWDRLAISKHVKDGHSIIARAKRLTWIGLALLSITGGFVARDIYGNTAGLDLEARRLAKGEVSLWQRLKANPWATVKSGFSFGSSEAPVIDERKLFAGTLAQHDIDPARVSLIADVQSLVSAEIASLNQSGKLSVDFPCDQMKRISEGWYKPDYPRCAYRDGLIFQASVVSAGPSSRPIPWMGIYRKVDGKWVFFNFKGRALQTLVLPGFESVDSLMIPRELAAQFPEIVAEPVVASKGEGDKARKYSRGEE